MHFFVTKRIYAYFFLSRKRFTRFFVAKMIYALRPESFCALKVAIQKVQTFWASGGGGRDLTDVNQYDANLKVVLIVIAEKVVICLADLG